MMRGFEVGIHCSDLTLTLARCPPRWSVCARIYVCVFSHILGECLALIGTGRHFVGLYCHMPLPILLLIRAAITGTHTHTLARTLTRQTHTLWHTLKARAFACH